MDYANAQERAFLNRARNLYTKALQQTQSSFPEDGASASETLEWAREAYANGDMTEEEFDSYMDQIIEQEEMENAREPAEVKHSIGPVKDAIDLSKDSELAKRVSGLYGSAKYKIIQEYILEVLGDQPVTLSDGKQAIVDRNDALHIANKAADKKTSQISKIREIVETAEIYAEDTQVKHNKFNYFCYYKADVRYEGDEFPLFLNVGRGINDGKYHIYDITNKIRDTADRINGLERPKPNEGYALTNGISNSSISQNKEKNNPSDKNSLETTVKNAESPLEKAKAAAVRIFCREKIPEY